MEIATLFKKSTRACLVHLLSRAIRAGVHRRRRGAGGDKAELPLQVLLQRGQLRGNLREETGQAIADTNVRRQDDTASLIQRVLTKLSFRSKSYCSVVSLAEICSYAARRLGKPELIA